MSLASGAEASERLCVRVDINDYRKHWRRQASRELSRWAAQIGNENSASGKFAAADRGDSFRTMAASEGIHAGEQNRLSGKDYRAL
jgi:hypothetical protein